MPAFCGLFRLYVFARTTESRDLSARTRAILSWRFWQFDLIWHETLFGIDSILSVESSLNFLMIFIYCELV